MRRTAVVVTTVLISLLGACGSDGGSSGDGGGTGSSAAAEDGGGSGGDEKASFDACTEITDAEAETVLGHPVAKKEIPGGGCQWDDPDEPRAASLSVSAATDVDQAGGIEGSKVGTQSVLNGDANDLPGIGDGAFLVVGTGKAFAKDQVQAQGVIAAGGLLVTVGITQLGGAAEADVSGQATAAMELVGSKL